MEINEFLKLVRKRRSIRRFKPDAVPDEYIDKIIEAARWAMSGANSQPWEFIIVKDPKMRENIATLLLEEAKETYSVESTRVEELRHPAFVDPPTELPGFKDAPVIIVLCGDPRTFQASVLATHLFAGDGNSFYKGLGNATQIIHLAVTALGLGSQWVSIHAYIEGKLKALLGVPDMFTIQTIIPIGYPAYQPPPPYRRKLSEIMHFDRYEQSKFRTDKEIKDYIRLLRGRTKRGYEVGVEQEKEIHSSLVYK
ncbi:nitroreductase family protein [Chloroflexota bacterium]